MRVFVSGATGVVGRRAVTRLLADGHAVTGVARSDAKAEWLRTTGAEVAIVDLFDADAVAAATAGFDALVNLATHIPPSRDAARTAAWAENDRIRTEISANIALAARQNAIPRIIQESIVLPYVDSGGQWITEETERRPTPRLQSVDVAESNALAAGEHDVTAVILRFGMFYAPDSSHTHEQVDLARKGMAPVIGSAGGYISSIHADDAAAAVVAALRARTGAYNVVDDEPLTRRAYAATIAAAVHNKHSSFMLAYMFKLIGESRTGGMARSLRVSNELFKDATGWSPLHESVVTGMPPVVAEILAGHGG